jgi:hypothetical protein
MTDADIDRIAERLADKLWERWNLHANVQIRRVFEQMMNEPIEEPSRWPTYTRAFPGYDDDRPKDMTVVWRKMPFLDFG